MVKEVLNSDDFRVSINVPNLVVVDYYATWCGPCRAIAPFYEQLSKRYPEVVFLKVGEHNCQDVIMSQGVRAFPTFQFLINGRVIDEIKGANQGELERKVNEHLSKGKASPFSGQGSTLGGTTWNGVGFPPGSEREARLKAFGQTTTSSNTTTHKSGTHAAPAPAPAPPAPKPVESIATTEEDEEEAIARAIAISMTSSNNNNKEESNTDNNNKNNNIENLNQDNDWDEEMVPVPVNEENLQQLIELGFEEVRARKGLVHGGDVDGAINWISEHQDDPDIDQPYMVKKKDTIPKVPLTEEEKAAKLVAYKEKIEKVKRERELKEKQDEIRREKERRERGQKMIETEEERTRALRKIEAEKAKREKLEAKLERERIKAELARDKELRRANNGVLPSVLSAEGYNPSAIQNPKSDTKRSREEENTQPEIKQMKSTTSNDTTTTSTSSSSTTTTNVVAPITKKSSPSAISNSGEELSQPRPDLIDTAINTISRYRTGGDGAQAYSLLLLFLQNIRDNPEEVKYKSINMESKAYKSKLGPLVGPTSLLKAVGFTHRPEEGKLYYEREDTQLLNETINKLSEALEKYRQLNG